MDDLRFLNRLVQDIAPDAQQTESARRSLLDHIDASQMRDQLGSFVDPVPDDTITIPPWSTRTPRSAWRTVATRIAVAASMIAVSALVVVGMLNLPAADATLENLARAVELLPNEAFTEVAVVRHAHTETLIIEPVDVTNPDLGLVGVIVTTDETRRQSPDGIIQTETTLTDATFITPIDTDTQSEIENRVGIGTTETTTAAPPDNLGTDRHILSSDPEAVYQQLLTSIAADGDTATPVSTQILDEIIGLHTTFVLTPPERAASIEVLAMVDDLTVNTDETTVTVTSDYVTETGQEALAAVFDQSGWLVAESLILLDGIPELTPNPIPAYKAKYTPPDLSS